MGQDKKKKKGGGETSTAESTWEMESVTSNVSSTTTSDSETSALLDDDDNVEKKDSLEALDERSDIEKELFGLILEGDRKAVKKFIVANRKNIDVTHRDLDGDNVLTHAVKQKDKKLVKLILSVDPGQIDIYDGLITAIENNQMGIMLILLKHEDVKQGGAFYATTKKLVAAASEKKRRKLKEMSTSQLVQELDQRKYGNDVTPLMMAASSGHYEIMQVLYDRGERLPTLHLPSCKCSECKGATRDLERINKRIELLKSMANPTYLIFMAGQDGSYDPVFEAFQLSDAIAQCINEEPEFCSMYEEIKESLDELPVDLLNLCRTMEEIKIVLSPKEGYEGPSNTPYPRLGYAINTARKKFVVHANVECLIRNMWIGHPWNTRSTSEKVIKYGIIFASMLLFPVFNIFLWLAMICCMELPLVQFLLSPINRCLSKLASHIALSALLLYMNSQERAEAEIEPPTIYIRWIVVVFVISQLFVLLRRFLLSPRSFWKHGWNKLESFAQCLFWCSFGLWVYLFDRKTEMRFEQSISRQQLDSTDPLLIEECLFALASTFSSLRIMRWYVLIQFIGPVQTGIARMWRVGFVVVIFVAWAAITFVVSTRILFRPFKGITKYDEETEKLSEQNMAMTQFDHMFLTFLGMESLPPDYVELNPPKQSFTNEMGEVDTVTNEPKVTQYFVLGLCITFNVLVMSFLQQAVIGLFASKGEEVGSAKEIEWRYLRIQEWLYNIQDTYLTPPFNLLPTGSCVLEAFSCFRSGGGGSSSKNKKKGNKDIESAKHNEREDAAKQYSFLMRKLFMRYFQEKRWEGEEENQPEIQDIYDVQDALKEVRNLTMDLLGVENRTIRSSRTGSNS